MARHRPRTGWGYRNHDQDVRSPRFRHFVGSKVISDKRGVLHPDDTRLPIARVVGDGNDRVHLVPDMGWNRYMANA